eukprot:15458847-Alexandrium_andersonii.AAC.1
MLSIASSSAYARANELHAADGAECCCNTARAPRLSELADTSVCELAIFAKPGGSPKRPEPPKVC